MSAGHSVRVARVYSQPEPGDGRRVLVDRLWPRGFRKDDPRIDTWLPKVAPSTELRHWYAHKPERFNEFAARYADELATSEGAAALAELRDLAQAGPVTLLTATREVDASHLAVLTRLLSRRPQ